MGESFTPHRPLRRRLAALTGASLLAAGLSLAVPPPARAAAGSIGYTCDQTLVGVLGVELPGAADLPLTLDTFQQVTVPLGGTVPQLSSALGLSSILDSLGATVGNVLGTVSGLTFTVGDNLTSLTGQVDTTTGAVTLPSFPLPSLPVDTLVPVSAPDTFTISTLGGLLGTLTCTIDAANDDVLGTILVGPASSDGSGDPAPTPTPTGGTTSGTSSGTSGGTAGGGTSAATYRLSATLVHRTVGAGQRARVRVRVVASDGSKPAGVVKVRRGHTTLGKRALVAGAATVPLKVLGPGRYRLTVSVDGLKHRLTLRVGR